LVRLSLGGATRGAAFRKSGRLPRQKPLRERECALPRLNSPFNPCSSLSDDLGLTELSFRATDSGLPTNSGGREWVVTAQRELRPTGRAKLPLSPIFVFRPVRVPFVFGSDFRQSV